MFFIIKLVLPMYEVNIQIAKNQEVASPWTKS
jgi:hypothetical protein